MPASFGGRTDTEVSSPVNDRMSDVAECTIPECVYNHGSRCHARAITVGNGDVPECHTFFSGHYHGPKRERQAGVGACRSYACRHNHGYDCTAGRTYVGYGSGGSITCLTYSEQ